MLTMIGRLVPGCCHRHIQAFKSETNPNFKKWGCTYLQRWRRPWFVACNELEMGHSSWTSGCKTARALQDSAFQNPGSSKEWMVNWMDMLLHGYHVGWNGTTWMTEYHMRYAKAANLKCFQKLGKCSRRHSLKMHRPRLNILWLLSILKRSVATGTIANECWKCL